MTTDKSLSAEIAHIIFELQQFETAMAEPQSWAVSTQIHDVRGEIDDLRVALQLYREAVAAQQPRAETDSPPIYGVGLKGGRYAA